MKKLACITPILFSICIFSTSAHADERTVDYSYYSGPVYPSVSEIPTPFIEKKIGFESLERFVNKHLSYIRSLDRENSGALTAEGLEEQRELAILANRRKQVDEILKYDMNVDAKVTEDELWKYGKEAKGYEPDVLERVVARLLKADIDSDGIITLREMSTLNDEVMTFKENWSLKNYVDYLKLDPNKDGQITREELAHLAKKAFATLDTDGNGTLSEEELAPYYALLEQEKLQ